MFTFLTGRRTLLPFYPLKNVFRAIMPEPLEQPVQTPAAAPPGEPAATPPPPAARKKRPKVDATAKLVKKYRLDARVRVLTLGVDGQPLGYGPMMDREAFNKFADLDHSPDKRYLDWMLFQAGGGKSAIDKSRFHWGVDSTEAAVGPILDAYANQPTGQLSQEDLTKIGSPEKQNVPNLASILPQASRVFSQAIPMTEKFRAMVEVIKRANRTLQIHPVDPEIQEPEAVQATIQKKQEKLAGEILSCKLKTFLRSKGELRVRDRVHVLYIWNKTMRGMSAEAAEAEWKSGLKGRMKEYIIGDQDSIKGGCFGFSRSWPGKDGLYARIYDAMRLFLTNRRKVESRNANIEKVNLEIASRNQALPEEDRLELREPIDLPDIGTVTLTKVVYTGPYPTVPDLESANEKVEQLSMRERIAGDVRFHGAQGKEGPEEKLFSDENLDLLLPLTLAASVKAGHPEWDISNPAQLRTGGRMTAWTQAHAGLEAFGGAGAPGIASFRRLVAMIHVKNDAILPQERRIRVDVAVEDLVDLPWPPGHLGELPVHFQVGADSEEYNPQQLLRRWHSQLDGRTYRSMGKSLFQAIKLLAQWGLEYPVLQKGSGRGEEEEEEEDEVGRPKRPAPFQGVIADPVAYYRAKARGKRGRLENLQMRVQQIVDLLTE
jgi:hypothetical protein